MPKKTKTIFTFSSAILLLFITTMPELVFGKTGTIFTKRNLPNLAFPINKPDNIINNSNKLDEIKNVKKEKKSKIKVNIKPKLNIDDKKNINKNGNKNVSDNNFIITSKHLIGQTIITFPWKSRVATAMFNRSNYIWIVFNKKAFIDIKQFKSLLPPFINSTQILPSKTHTILRLHSNIPIFNIARKVKNSNDWNIILSNRNKTSKTIIRTSTVTGSKISPHVLISTFETAEPIYIKDPDVEDNLIIIPLYPQDTGIFPERSFIDFKILRSAQGIAIENYRDELTITKLQNGIRIAAKTYTTLSENLPKLNIKKLVNSEKSSSSMFPYKKWKAKDAINFLLKKQEINKKISEADYQQAMLLRMKLAKLFLAEGYNSEALGMLNIIYKLDKRFYQEYQLAALHGAANFMIYRLKEAESDFSSNSLANIEEIQIWKLANSMLLGKKTPDYDPIKFDELYAKYYPPKMRQRFAIIAIDRAISLNKLYTAKKIINNMQKKNILKDIPDYKDYMISQIYAANGNITHVITILKDIIDRTNDRFIYVHANFTLATILYNNNKITKDDFIKRLDRIRLLWRGDSLEINVLNTLGELYISQGKYLEGLRAWKEIISYYPFTMNAVKVASRMAETFVTLFNEGKADKMKPLNALALYYEFRELTPIGKAGDLMVRNLADRLVQVDLLSRAAALLEHQVRYRLEGEERSKIGARLALLYLLNRQPQKTISSLELTEYGNNDKKLENKRRYLAAVAYSQLGKTKLALRILEDDYSIEAKQIRLDIYWENKDWIHLIPTAEDIISSRKDVTANLTNTEVQTLLRLAIAYTFENDTLQLQYLRDYFTPLMDGHPLKESFLYITNDRGIITPDNIDTISKDINQIEGFLSNYHESIKINGLSNVFE